ncbi:MAG: hypothetical protein OEM01_03340 [Desulfobulbaceae bacterium]|nr:hypothetical protein [Desulfobulbaceae bacterium]
MPRSAGIILSDTPHHIVQCGNNRRTFFVSNDDNRYRENLIDFKRASGCGIYACCRCIGLNPLRNGMATDPAEYRLVKL